MRARLRLRHIPRRLLRRDPGPMLPRIIALIAAALLLRLFFLLVKAGGSWSDSIDTAFFRTVLLAELGNGIDETLSVFSRRYLVTGQSAILSGEESYPFTMSPDDGFSGDFPVFAPVTDVPSGEEDVQGENADDSEKSDYANPAETVPAPAATDSSTLSAVDSDPNVRTVTIVPLSAAGYDYSDGVYIKNETSYDIDVGSILGSKPDLELKKDGPVILIVHTHASEAYYPDGEDVYTPTDTERTDDKNYNVVRVGDEMASVFEARGYGVLHIRDIFDYPSYNGSYTRTLEAIEKVLNENPSIQIVLDIHRDAIVSASGVNFRTVTEIEGRKAAQILIVVGTDEGGLRHKNWRSNLTLAVHMQKHISDEYPMLMRPINLRPERFNQNATSGSLIVEVGTSSNTLREALYAAGLFASSACDFLDQYR